MPAAVAGPSPTPQALLESPDAQLADTAGLQMAVALGYCVYSLRENKRMGLGGNGAARQGGVHGAGGASVLLRGADVGTCLADAGWCLACWQLARWAVGDRQGRCPWGVR